MQNNLPTSQQVLDIFKPRTDAVAAWKTKHPIPARTADGQDIGLSLNHLDAHLRGETRIGIYSTQKDDTCTWMAVDIDSFETATDDARAVVKTLQQHGFDALLERSQSGQGYHIWILLDGSIAAYKLRIILMDILRKSGIQLEGKLKSEKAYDRIYPNQDTINSGYGNLLALPFWGKAVLANNCLFIDPETLESFQDQVAYLQQIKRTTESQIDEYIQQHKLSKASNLAAQQREKSERKFDNSQLGNIEDIQHCEYIKHCDEHRSDLPESLWYALISNLVVFAEDGRPICHALSEGHKNYLEKETDYQFNKASQAIEQGKHPISCKRLSREGFTCPRLGQCGAKFVADFPTIYADTAMTLMEMQQYTHAIHNTSETSSELKRFALGYQQLSNQDQAEILDQVMQATAGGDRERKELEKKLKAIKPAANQKTKYLPTIRDYYANAPCADELVLPRGYIIQHDKLFAIRKNKQGEQELELIADQVLIVVETGHDYELGEAATRTIAFRNASGEWTSVQVPRAESSDGRTLHKALGNTSFIMSSDQGIGITRYLKDCEIANGLILLPKTTTSRLGWIKINDKLEYIPYSDVARLMPRGMGDKALTMKETFEAKGTAKEWLRLFTMLQAYPEATLILVAALTPPLFLVFETEAQSHTIALAGSAGTGKSAIQKIAATAYGVPTALVRSWNSTAVGFEQALALRTHMPALYEDLQNATDKQVNDLVYHIFNSLGRERGAKEGGTRRTAEFSTVMIASAESDIRDKAQFQGFLRRSLVVTAPVFGQLQKTEISGLVAQLAKQAEANRASFGRDWVGKIKSEILEQSENSSIMERLQYWSKSLQGMVPNSFDATLARLMAQHMITAELVEQWYGVERVVERLQAAWVGMMQDIGEHDIFRKYMVQLLEWAASEANTGGAFSEVGGKQQLGVLNKDYLAVMPTALEQYLRNVNHQSDINYKVILKEWADRGWLQRSSEGGITTTVSVVGTKIRMAKIPLHAKGLPEVIVFEPVVEVQDEKAILMRLPSR